MTWLFVATPHEFSVPAEAFVGEVVHAGFSPPYGYSSVTYSVDFGDGTAPVTGTTAGLVDATHRYTTPGTYTVTATQDAWSPASEATGIVVTFSPPTIEAGDSTETIVLFHPRPTGGFR